MEAIKAGDCAGGMNVDVSLLYTLGVGDEQASYCDLEMVGLGLNFGFYTMPFANHLPIAMMNSLNALASSTVYDGSYLNGVRKPSGVALAGEPAASHRSCAAGDERSGGGDQQGGELSCALRCVRGLFLAPPQAVELNLARDRTACAAHDRKYNEDIAESARVKAIICSLWIPFTVGTTGGKPHLPSLFALALADPAAGAPLQLVNFAGLFCVQALGVGAAAVLYFLQRFWLCAVPAKARGSPLGEGTAAHRFHRTDTPSGCWPIQCKEVKLPVPFLPLAQHHLSLLRLSGPCVVR